MRVSPVKVRGLGGNNKLASSSCLSVLSASRGEMSATLVMRLDLMVSCEAETSEMVIICPI